MEVIEDRLPEVVVEKQAEENVVQPVFPGVVEIVIDEEIIVGGHGFTSFRGWFLQPVDAGGSQRLLNVTAEPWTSMNHFPGNA